MKRASSVDWPATPGFAILHQGATLSYLVLCWWGNDNELFVRVAVLEEGRWVIDKDRFSFRIWDMEIMWLERKSYIRCMYSGAQDLTVYRADIVVRRARETRAS